MRIILTSIVFIFYSIVITQAQVENHMVEDNNIWIYKEFDEGKIYYSGYYLKGDTTINNKEYKVLYDLVIKQSDFEYWEIDKTADLDIAAFLREEENKVYFLLSENKEPEYTDFNCTEYAMDEEMLLYDFSVMEGDTTGCYVVDSIMQETKYERLVNKYRLGGYVYYSTLGGNSDLLLDQRTTLHASYYKSLAAFCNDEHLNCAFDFIDDKEYYYKSHYALLSSQKIDDTEYRFFKVGDCHYGKLQVVNYTDKTLEYPMSYGYVTQAEFYNNDSSWVLLARAKIADDVGEEFISFMYKVEDSYLEQKVNVEELSAYSTFCIHNEYLIIGDENSSTFYVIDYDGDLVDQFNPDFAANKIYSNGTNIYLIGEKNILVLDGNYETVDTIQFAAPIIKPKWYNNKLYMIIGKDLVRISLEDNTQTTYALPSEDFFRDYEITDRGAILLYSLSKDYTIYTYDLENSEIIEEAKYSSLPLGISNFLDGYNSKKVCGYHFSHYFIYPMDELEDFKYNIALDVKSIVVETDSMEANGQKYPIYNYTIDYEVENKGETLESFQLRSSVFGGINCARFRIHEEVDTYLFPMDSRSYTATISSRILKDDKVCLSVSAPNGNPDKDLSDNYICHPVKLSSTIEPPQQDASIYPNPVRETLSINIDKNISSVRIYNLSGAEMRHIIYYRSNKIDVRSLKPGSYLLEVTTKKGHRSMMKFVKI